MSNELGRFNQLEVAVAKGLTSFLEVGSALLEIQAGWDTFKNEWRQNRVDAKSDTFEE